MTPVAVLLSSIPINSKRESCLSSLIYFLNPLPAKIKERVGKLDSQGSLAVSSFTNDFKDICSQVAQVRQNVPVVAMVSGSEEPQGISVRSGWTSVLGSGFLLGLKKGE